MAVGNGSASATSAGTFSPPQTKMDHQQQSSMFRRCLFVIRRKLTNPRCLPYILATVFNVAIFIYTVLLHHSSRSYIQRPELMAVINNQNQQPPRTHGDFFAAIFVPDKPVEILSVKEVKTLTLDAETMLEPFQKALPASTGTRFMANPLAKKMQTCSKVKGRRIVINYAQGCCQTAQPKNCETALNAGAFDVCIMFNRSIIDDFFFERNPATLKNPRVAGLGAWKPIIILKTLLAMDVDDVLFYADSGSHFTGPLENHFCLMADKHQDVVTYSVGLPENQYTKPDAFVLTGCVNESHCVYSDQRNGAFSAWHRSVSSFAFLSTWLTFCLDDRIISHAERFDFANQGKAHTPQFNFTVRDFTVHRHDQSALSLAAKLWNIPVSLELTERTCCCDNYRSIRPLPRQSLSTLESKISFRN